MSAALTDSQIDDLVFVYGPNCPIGEAREIVRAALAAAPLPPQSAARSDQDVPEAIRLLAVMVDGYENGVDCYEDPENLDGYMGPAFRVDNDEFVKMCELLNRRAPKEKQSAAQAKVRVCAAAGMCHPETCVCK